MTASNQPGQSSPEDDHPPLAPRHSDDTITQRTTRTTTIAGDNVGGDWAGRDKVYGNTFNIAIHFGSPPHPPTTAARNQHWLALAVLCTILICVSAAVCIITSSIVPDQSWQQRLLIVSVATTISLIATCILVFCAIRLSKAGTFSFLGVPFAWAAGNTIVVAPLAALSIVAGVSIGSVGWATSTALLGDLPIAATRVPTALTNATPTPFTPPTPFRALPPVELARTPTPTFAPPMPTEEPVTSQTAAANIESPSPAPTFDPADQSTTELCDTAVVVANDLADPARDPIEALALRPVPNDDTEPPNLAEAPVGAEVTVYCGATPLTDDALSLRGWVRVQYNGETGFMARRYLRDSP